MKSVNAPSSADPPRRAYNQGARARAAEQTAERILDAFARRIRDDWFEEITLEQIARDAEVTVPTVVRRFGGKDGLLDAVKQRVASEIHERRRIAPGDIAGALAVLVEDYEAAGDLVMRVLAQEERHAPFRAMTDAGRASHRAWIAAVFSPWLEPLPEEARRDRLDTLVVATDLYTWKLLRRDMGRSAAETRILMQSLAEGILGAHAGTPSAAVCPEVPRRD